jgi:hypothetical protein
MALSTAEKFLALGLDLQTASRLVANRWTASRLKRATAHELDTLGIGQDARERFKRPPIPSEVLFKVLHKSRRTCCVCRNSSLPIIVHHIEEWHSSHDHAENNLAVLCLIDHDGAHTTHKLSQNLTADMIRKHKAEWEEQVKTADAKIIVGLSTVEGANWDYVNLARVFRLAQHLNINPQMILGFHDLLSLQLITPQGDLHPTVYAPPDPPPCLYLCGLSEGRMLYAYTTEMLEAIVQRLGVVDISSARSYTDIRSLADDGSLVFVQAPFYFRKESKIAAGVGQTRAGYTKLGGVKIQFVFDAWESTSLSAHSDRLSGRKVESVLGLVSGSDYTTPSPTLQLSCLGMGSWFGQIRPVPTFQLRQEEEEGLAEEDGMDGDIGTGTPF